MSGTRAKSHGKERTLAYQAFVGLDSSRDLVNKDTGDNQALEILNNGSCDEKGQIIVDANVLYRGGEHAIKHLRHFNDSQVCWAEVRNGGVFFNSELDHVAPDTQYPENAIITSTFFNRQAIFAARGLRPLIYDGKVWSSPTSSTVLFERPAFVCTVQRRLCFAGLVSSSTKVAISRVDDVNIFLDDQAPDESSPLRAGEIDISNLLGTADSITGIGEVENDKLVIFTSDRVVIYSLDPEIENWKLDSDANSDAGCLSHNTIVNTGTQVIFCSRRGVHALRRVEANGLQIGTIELSKDITLMYRKLVRAVDDPQDISAVWDRDENQYHIFFPQGSSNKTVRLTATLVSDDEGAVSARWSTGTFLEARCGSSLAGTLIYGTPGGVYETLAFDDERGTSPELEIETPVIWGGPFDMQKRMSRFLLQAYGSAEVETVIMDEDRRELTSHVFQVEDVNEDTGIRSIPLFESYERAVDLRFRGLIISFRVRAKSLFRLIGFALFLKGE